MDWFHIVELIFQGILALFTVILAFTTKHYVKATKELVSVTKQYTEATNNMVKGSELSAKAMENLQRAEVLNFVGTLYHNMIQSGVENRYARALLGIDNRDITSFTEAEKKEWGKLRTKTQKVYGLLTNKLLDEISRELDDKSTI